MSNGKGNLALGPPPDDFGPDSGEYAEIEPVRFGIDDMINTSDFPSELLQARDEMEDVLRGQGDLRNGVRSAEDLTDVTNILGVGVGRAAALEYGPRRSAIEPGQLTLTVYLAEPRHPDEVESVVIEELGVRSAAARSVPVTPVVTGLIEHSSHAFRLRPAPGGISCGSVALGGSGTLGCLATGRSAPRNERTLIVSNNHVLANTNLGTIGDCIVQPGSGDGGTCANDQVAVLERFVPISFGGGAVNYVDCATAWAWPDRVSPQELFVTAAGATTFAISPNIIPATSISVGAVVGKSGRTTQLTTGTIREYPASTWINYGGGNSAFFAGLVAVEGSPTFGDKGDSGSLVWTWDVNRNPVSLYFADGGAGTRTFSNPIDFVLANLDIFILA